MSKPRAVVVDTNVIVAGLLTANPESPTAVILDEMLRAGFVFLLSEPLLAEYRTVLLRPAIRERHGLGEREVDDLLAEIARYGIVRDLALSEEIAPDAPDPNDQHLWDLAGSEPGAVLVTGDFELVSSPSAVTKMLSPRELVELLKPRGGRPEFEQHD